MSVVQRAKQKAKEALAYALLLVGVAVLFQVCDGDRAKRIRVPPRPNVGHLFWHRPVEPGRGRPGMSIGPTAESPYRTATVSG